MPTSAPEPVVRRVRICADLIKPHPRQWAFLEALGTHHYVLYGGAAGGGKSYLLRWGLVYLLFNWAAAGLRGVRVGLFSRDYPTLHDRQLSKIRAEFPEWLGTFHEQRREFELAPAYGGGVICFRNLDDPAKYRSAEFAAIACEELTENEESVFDLLRFRLRWPGVEHPKFLGATNPGGLGGAWVKRLWINRDFPPNLAPYESWFTYIPAKATDNPHLAVNYHQQLDSLPEQMRAAMRDGSWDSFVGQKFQEWRWETHTCEPFAIPSWWARWRSNDPGYSDPSLWHWFAADQDGRVYCYREAEFIQVVGSEQAKAVKDSSVRVDENQAARPLVQEEFDWTVTGMDAFIAQDRSVGKSDVDYYHEGGLIGFVRPIHGPNSRAQRAKTIHEYLRIMSGRGHARLTIFRPGALEGVKYGCPRLIETLPQLICDPLDVEKVKMCDADHAYDALSYGISKWHSDRSDKPAEKLPANSIGHILGHDEPEPVAKEEWEE